MHKRLFATLTLIAGFLALALPNAASYAASRNLPGQYIVVFDPATTDVHGRANALAHRYGGEVGFTYEHAIKGFSVRLPDAQVAKLQAEPGILSVVQDQEVTIAAKPGGGGGGGPQVLPTGIDRIDGELSSAVAGNGSGSVDVDVAVIDTGVDKTHADLNVVGGVNCSTGGPNSYGDGNGHGTHVAGTIGALDNNLGVVGVAPGARIWAVRVLNNAGSGTWSGIVCGIDWVTARADVIEVANMSLGGTGSEPSGSGCNTGDALHDAICNSVGAGVTYVVAAGNETDDAKNHVPAAYDEVITVSALADFDGKSGGLGSSTCRADQDDTLASFSNYGADVDIIAPGVCINSTWKGGGYNTISGTSMASPHVAGAAALYASQNPSAGPSQIKSALINAGTTDWNNSDDHDNTKERLLNVAGF